MAVDQTTSTANRAQPAVYQLKVTLKRIKPPIWRRIEVKGDISLYRLHRILQIVMGWGEYHLYEFAVGGRNFGEPDPEMGLEIESSRRMKLTEIVPVPRRRLNYTYDFGDNWEHEVLVEKIVPAEAGVRYPRCTGGKRACPPEDCGGVWGYEHLLEVLADPQDPEHDEMLEWVGGSFDPESFDLKGINERLRRVR